MPGFREAWYAGQVPVVPGTPPALLPGPSAEQLFHRWLLHLVAGVAVLLVGVALLPDDLEWLGGPAGLVGMVLALRGFSRVGDRNLEELERGYTTFTMVFGDFWPGGRRYTGHRMPWDYSGAWQLHRSTGEVLRPPQRELEPPGFYPSPHAPGKQELWTGSGWSGHLRPRERGRGEVWRRVPHRTL